MSDDQNEVDEVARALAHGPLDDYYTPPETPLRKRMRKDSDEGVVGSTSSSTSSSSKKRKITIVIEDGDDDEPQAMITV